MSYDSNNNNLFSDSYQISSALHEMSYQQKVSTLQIEIAKATDRETRQRLQALLDETIEKHNKGRTGMFIIAVIMLILVLGIAGFIFFWYLPSKDAVNANPNNIHLTPAVSSTQTIESSQNNQGVQQTNDAQTASANAQEKKHDMMDGPTNDPHDTAEWLRNMMEAGQGLNRDVLNSISDSEILRLVVGYIASPQIAQTAANLVSAYPDLKNPSAHTDGKITVNQFKQWVSEVWNNKYAQNTNLLNNPNLTLTTSVGADGLADAKITSNPDGKVIDEYRIDSHNHLQEAGQYAGGGSSDWVNIGYELPSDAKNIQN